MSRISFAISLAAGLLIWGVPNQSDALPDHDTLRSWIKDIQARDRGPFERLRWFCSDGSIHPPRPYPCEKRGGGHQHGEWNSRTKELRDGGYYIANILAGLDPEKFLSAPGYRTKLNHIMIEQYLVNAYDGWIYKKARFYRGAIQDEDERAAGRELLEALTFKAGWVGQRYLALRTAARLIRHGAESDTVGRVRRLSATLSDKNRKFLPLRNKIHGRPDATDAAAVRAFAAGLPAGQRGQYEELAGLIDAVYTSAASPDILADLSNRFSPFPDLEKALGDGAKRLAENLTPSQRFVMTATMMGALRDIIPLSKRPKTRLDIVDATLVLEAEHFTAATQLPKTASRRTRLAWLRSSIEASYGAGLISNRQRKALAKRLAELSGSKVSLADYKSGLQYLALVPGWSGQWMRFQFQEAMDKLAQIEPHAELFIQDQLRGSPLFFYAKMVDTLLRDANSKAGVRNELFGTDVGAGLRSLNPGLARGRLFLSSGEGTKFARDGIYLLPETIAELPPVAGILTAGEGNPLSHVQLLARNLGIPNVAIDENLIEQLRRYDGVKIILAVSPAGSVHVAEDDGQWEAIFGSEDQQTDVLIKPDLEKLNLWARDMIPLSKLRAIDSGRTVGPKAAKLGELHHKFPRAVADGLTIPFGVFRDLLEQAHPKTGTSIYDWMVGEYRKIGELPARSEERANALESFRKELYDLIANADPGQDFRNRLKQAMARVFGKDGTYGVFVRSDTNVEDLPGFTGAGLNLTVPNVVGFNNIVKAISRVWASPFTARAFAWRQSLMDQPEHVYPAVLLLRSVPAEKSGVMVTQEIDTGDTGWLSVAVNEGVGGAVDGQAAENLRIEKSTGKVVLLAQATATVRRQVSLDGGVKKVPVSTSERVLEDAEIAQLIQLANDLPTKFPSIVDAAGKPAPADKSPGIESLEKRRQLQKKKRPFRGRSAKSTPSWGF